MPRKNSLFTRKNSETTTLSLKVPTGLKSRLDEVSKQLQAIDPELQFNYQDKLRSELEKLVKSAETELKKMNPDNAKPTSTEKKIETLTVSTPDTKPSSQSLHSQEKELEYESA